MALPVNEIFTTIQGEASFTGTPSTFVRLQGCDVGCGWCDTKHTWKTLDKDMIPIKDMLAKTCDTSNWTPMTEPELLKEIMSRQPSHVVITGGEPCEHDLLKLTTMLIEKGRTVQIETSGTKIIKANDKTFITLSPKWDMAGGLKVLKKNYELANEIKVPIGKRADVDKIFKNIPIYKSLIASDMYKYKMKSNVWLQPLSQSKKSTELCIKTATKYNFKISIQTHKFIGVR